MLTDDGLYRLMTWLSPAFPVGAFSYSHGIEYAVEQGLASDPQSLTGWVATILERGGARSDAILFCAAWRAAHEGDEAGLDDIAEQGEVWRGSAEMAVESGGQGNAFLDTVRQVWPDQRMEAWAERLDSAARVPAYGVAVGAVAGWLDVPLRPSLSAYLQAAAANLVSAAVRLIPLGQTDGQRVLAALAPVVRRAADAAEARSLADLGGAAPLIDWTSMRHETQYTRLFRS